MKLQALRVRGVGPFAAGAAVEGLSGGLDVLIGPNEAGKSTLFRALETVFFNPYSTGGAQFMDALSSGAGHRPLIEADFDVAGVRWRITKQYSLKVGKSRSAQLVALGGGQSILHDEAAEDKLAQLVGLGGGKAGRLGFLWVGQGEGLEPWHDDARTKAPKQIKEIKGQQSALSAVLEREIAAVTGSSLLSGVQARLTQELALLKTQAQMKPKAGGAWDLALKRQADLAARLEAATRARDQSEQRRKELAQINTTLEAKGSREALAVEAESIATAQRQLEKAGADRRLFEAAERRAQFAEQNEVALARALAALQADIATYEQLENASVAAGPQFAALEAGLKHQRGDAKVCEDAIARLRGALDHADALMLVREQRRFAAVARIRMEELVATWTRGQALVTEIAQLTKVLALAAVSDADLDAVQKAEAELLRAVDALAAGAPTIAIAYELGAAGSIIIGGVGAREGVQAPSDGPIVLDIAGIGRITVSAGAGADRLQWLADRDRTGAELAARLSRLGVVDVAAVRARHTETRTRQGQLESAQAQVLGLAPNGLDAMASEIASVRAGLTAVAIPEASADEDAILADSAVQRAELAQQVALAKALASMMLDLTGDSERQKANDQHRAAQMAEIQKRLPPRDQWASVLRERTTQLEVATQDASMKLREVAAVRDGLATTADCALLERELALLREAQAGRVRELSQLKEKRGELVGAETNADELGLASQVQALQGEWERAQAEVGRQQARVDALALLGEVLDDIERDNQERFLAPVRAHVAPFLEIMFPSSGQSASHLGFDKELSVQGLQRGTQSHEPLARLSGGTQEQIAVLVRLGFGQLLAQTGQAAPVILDDALVYCDDERIVRVFHALELASRNHQVIVLSCRERTFEQLGGHRVHITSWDA
jgi:energy-coupling factor transporter ATP-binding protein EcfA2